MVETLRQNQRAPLGPDAVDTDPEPPTCSGQSTARAGLQQGDRTGHVAVIETFRIEPGYPHHFM